VNTFGNYQTFYESDLLSSYSPSAISWIGSIQMFLLMFVGAATGPIYDAGYARHLIYFGTFFTSFGMMMLSICHQYWQVLLAQAICVGLGTGMLFVPSVALLSTYFTTRLATAIGIAATGSGIGKRAKSHCHILQWIVHLMFNRWCPLSHHISSVTTSIGIRLGHSSIRFYSYFDTGHTIGYDESALASCVPAQDRGLGSFQRITVSFFSDWLLPWVCGTLRTIHLHSDFLHTARNHNRRFRVLSPSHPQCCLDIRPTVAESPSRPCRPLECDCAMCNRCWCTYHQPCPCQYRQRYCNFLRFLRLFHRHFCLPSAYHIRHPVSRSWTYRHSHGYGLCRGCSRVISWYPCCGSDSFGVKLQWGLDI
jgi:hypothetical protein